jgi:hypothetical protein
MKKILTGVAGFIVIAGGLIFVYQQQLMAVGMDAITADMFVEADTDSFDPGPTVGETFPAIRALRQGQQITSIQELAGDKGTVFIANRSADW